MPSGYVLGLNANAYYNTGSYLTPTWVPITIVGDIEIPVEFDEADATTRASGGWEQVLASIAKSTIDMDLKYNTIATEWIALQAAAFSRAITEFLFLDGPLVHSGSNTVSQGIRLSCTITKFGLAQKLKEIMANPLTLRPAPSANPPAWFSGT